MPAKNGNEPETIYISVDSKEYMRGVLERRREIHEKERSKEPKPKLGSVYEEAIEAFRRREKG